MSAIFTSFYKNVTVPGTAVAMGTAATPFNVGIFIPQKSATEENAGDVHIIQLGGVGRVTLFAGQTPYIVRAPMNTFFTADQFTVDANTAGDGVLFVYAMAQFNSFNSVEMKLENAMKKLVETISGTIDDCSITAGLTNEDERTGDNVRCVVTDAEEEILNSALWRCKAQVIVQTRCDQSDAQQRHRLRTAYVRDVFTHSDTDALLASLEPNFTVQGKSICNRSLEHGYTGDGRKFLSVLKFEICCCGNQIF